MLAVSIFSPKEVAMQVATRVRSRRLELNLTQSGLARRAGTSLATYRRFETTGEISFSGLLRVAMALDCLDEFSQLFTRKKYNSLAEVVSDSAPKRKRGNKE